SNTINAGSSLPLPIKAFKESPSERLPAPSSMLASMSTPISAAQASADLCRSRRPEAFNITVSGECVRYRQESDVRREHRYHWTIPGRLQLPPADCEPHSVG